MGWCAGRTTSTEFNLIETLARQARKPVSKMNCLSQPWGPLARLIGALMCICRAFAKSWVPARWSLLYSNRLSARLSIDMGMRQVH